MLSVHRKHVHCLGGYFTEVVLSLLRIAENPQIVSEVIISLITELPNLIKARFCFVEQFTFCKSLICSRPYPLNQELGTPLQMNTPL